MSAKIIVGDCLDVLRTLPDGSVDSVVTDPPYGLSFMGKSWDYDVPKADVWREVIRVLKPGGHLLSFFGTRTYHRGVVQIEDAGFEIRDQIGWAYGSGFPKSLDVSKAIDKAAGVEFEAKPASGVGFMNAEGEGGYNVTKNQLSRAGESTEAAKQWNGWGTALKPAWEPIVVARKPLIGTVAENVLAHGTGAINVDGCRVGTDAIQVNTYAGRGPFGTSQVGNDYDQKNTFGRWPANLIHDGSEEVAGCFPVTTSGKPCGNRKAARFAGAKENGTELTGFGDSGSAARFFYCAKASKRDRDDGLESFEAQSNMRVNGPREDEEAKTATKRSNHHPTVKPTNLMRWLVRLVTPPGGTVLDPFCGSGSTGKAAVLEGFNFIGVEREPEYAKIAEARILAAQASVRPATPRLPIDPTTTPPSPVSAS